jgi:hypothetical protein
MLRRRSGSTTRAMRPNLLQLHTRVNNMILIAPVAMLYRKIAWKKGSIHITQGESTGTGAIAMVLRDGLGCRAF